MGDLLRNSMFYEVLFPEIKDVRVEQDLLLTKTVRFQVSSNQSLKDITFVVFDLETTGLDSANDRIIELGAQKFVNLKVVDEFSTLIQVSGGVSKTVEKITGINETMLVGQPLIEEVLPKFLSFIKGSVLVAHNANFDISFLKTECTRQGIELFWPALCTLKMARKYLSELESRTLDAIAKHYGFTFESRHRSIGDVKVTFSFLEKLLTEEKLFPTLWKDCSVFEV